MSDMSDPSDPSDSVGLERLPRAPTGVRRSPDDREPTDDNAPPGAPGGACVLV